MTDLAERRGLDTEVYEPAEDSAILAGAAVERVEPGDRVLDVGTGSGYVAERVAQETDAAVIACDVNPHACARAAGAGLPTVRADLTTPFVGESFDLVVFNPPYLPALPDAAWSDWLETALTGGETGREVIERFLDDVGRVLVASGEVLLLVSTVSGVEEIVEYAGGRGFSAAALTDVAYPGETLTVLRLWRG